MSNKFDVILTGGSLPDPCKVNTDGMVKELWPEYLDSTESFLSYLEESAMAIESGKSIDENVASIRRILHTLKGEAGIIGMNDIYELCHSAESAFEEFADKSESVDMILHVKDWIHSVLKYAKKPCNGSDTEAESKSPKFRTLIVDDAPVCRKRMQMLLKDYFDCSFAYNGLEAFKLYKKSVEDGNRFNLIALDIIMPEMNGHEALESIRKFEASCGIKGLDGVKIIMMTTEDSSKHIFSAFREGCEAYVVKSNIDSKLFEEISKLGLLEEQVQKSYVLK